MHVDRPPAVLVQRPHELPQRGAPRPGTPAGRLTASTITRMGMPRRRQRSARTPASPCARTPRRHVARRQEQQPQTDRRVHRPERHETVAGRRVGDRPVALRGRTGRLGRVVHDHHGDQDGAQRVQEDHTRRPRCLTRQVGAHRLCRSPSHDHPPAAHDPLTQVRRHPRCPPADRTHPGPKDTGTGDLQVPVRCAPASAWRRHRRGGDSLPDPAGWSPTRRVLVELATSLTAGLVASLTWPLWGQMVNGASGRDRRPWPTWRGTTPLDTRYLAPATWPLRRRRPDPTAARRPARQARCRLPDD